MKRFFLIINLLSIFIIANSQEQFVPYIGVGVQGGLNKTWLDLKTAISNDEGAINASLFGLVINYVNKPVTGIQIEVNLSQRGWQEDTILNYTRKMEYLEIPFLSHLTFGKKLMRYTIDLGPYVAFHRTYVEDFKGASTNEDGSFQIPIELYKDIFGEEIDNTFDYGYMVGAGIGVNTKLGEYLIRFRYSQSLNNIWSQYPNSNYYKSKIRGIYVGLSYTYNIKLNRTKKLKN
jgi:hypothetical protein